MSKKRVSESANKSLVNTRRKSKRTSVGKSKNSRPVNKSKRRSYKRYNRQGK